MDRFGFLQLHIHFNLPPDTYFPTYIYMLVTELRPKIGTQYIAHKLFLDTKLKRIKTNKQDKIGIRGDFSAGLTAIYVTSNVSLLGAYTEVEIKSRVLPATGPFGKHKKRAILAKRHTVRELDIPNKDSGFFCLRIVFQYPPTIFPREN